MTPEQIARATWYQNSESTIILKCCVKDGSAVLATITKLHYFKWTWRIDVGRAGGYGRTRHTAMRHARKALRAEQETSA